jgi:ParB family chromosome partitioning protein
VVRPKGKATYELVAGERRFRAATQAGLREIPAVVREIDDKSSLAIALIENIQRQELNPVESARAYQRLLTEFRLTQTELAAEVGKSQPAIANSLRLLQLPEPIIDSLGSKGITEGHAKAILAIEEDEDKITVWKAVVKGALSVRETERRVAAIKATIPRGIPRTIIQPNKVEDIETEKLQQELSLTLGTKVKINFQSREKGQIEIQFYGLDQLDGLLQKIAGEK